MNSTVFDKTDKGREEIATRTYRLPPRLRPLLVLVDGKQDGAQVLQKLRGLGLTEQSMRELLDQGFIRPLPGAGSVAGSASDATASTQSAHPRPAAIDAPVLPEGQNQFQSIYRFYTETIKNTLGLRGYALQLKVEKAASVDDFHALRRPYLDAVLKAKGNEMARSLRDRLDQLLYRGETAAPTTIAGAQDASEQ